MNFFKTKFGEDKFKKNEMQINFWGSFIAGILAAAITNPFEMITVNK